MEFQEVINSRKMVRSFSTKPISTDKLEIIIYNMLSGPSAGYSQGTQLLIVTQKEYRELFFEQWGSSEDRQPYLTHWPNIENAPVIILVCSDASRYQERYSRHDKQGLSEEFMPWWDIDAGMSTLLGLLTVVDQGLVATFTGVKDQTYLRTHFKIPDNIKVIGAILLGHQQGSYRPSKSVAMGRRSKKEIVHYNQW